MSQYLDRVGASNSRITEIDLIDAERRLQRANEVERFFNELHLNVPPDLQQNAIEVEVGNLIRILSHPPSRD